MKVKIPGSIWDLADVINLAQINSYDFKKKKKNFWYSL